MNQSPSSAPGASDTTPVSDRRGVVLRVGAAVVGLGLASLLVIDGSRAAFTATTDNTGNTINGGTVVLADDDSGTAMFNLAAVNGGQSFTRCINVTYTGTLNSDVKLYTTGVDSAAADPLAPGLDVTVETGTGAAGGNTLSCTGFTGATSQFVGTLDTMGKTYATGVGGFDNASGAGAGTKKSYRITVTVSNLSTYQGKSAAWGFTWEAAGLNPA